MKSIGQVAKELGVPYKRLNRWIREFNVGSKVGWGIVLSDEDVISLRKFLEEKSNLHRGKRGRPMSTV